MNELTNTSSMASSILKVQRWARHGSARRPCFLRKPDKQTGADDLHTHPALPPAAPAALPPPPWPIPTVPALALLRLTQRRCGHDICHRWVPGTSAPPLCNPIGCPSTGATSFSCRDLDWDVHMRLSRRSRSPHPRDNAPASPLHLALSPGSPAPCLAKCADPSGRRLIRLENGAQSEQRQDGTVMGSQRRRRPHRLRRGGAGENQGRTSRTELGGIGSAKGDSA